MSKFIELTCFAFKEKGETVVNTTSTFPVLLNINAIISVDALVDKKKGTCVTGTDGKYFTHEQYEDVKARLKQL